MKAGFFDAHDAGSLLRMKREATDELKGEFGFVAFELTLADEAGPSASE